MKTTQSNSARTAWAAVVMGLAASTALGAIELTTGPGPASPSSPVYAGEEVALTVAAKSDEGLPLTYSWKFGDGEAATPYASEPSVRHVFDSPARLRVSVRIKEGDYAPQVFFFDLLVHVTPTPGWAAASSTILYDASAKRVWNVNPDNHSVACIDGRTLERLFEVPAGRNPATLAKAPDGSVWVANHASSTISVLDGTDGRKLATIGLPYASAPWGIVFSPDGKSAYVSLEATGELARLDPETRSVTDRVKVGPSPRGLAVTHDSRRVFATRFISAQSHGEIYEVDSGTFTRVRTMVLPMDRSPDAENAGGGVPNYISSCMISLDGKMLWYAATKANVLRGSVRDGRPLSHENTVRTFVGRVDLTTNSEKPEGRVDLDDSDRAAALIPNAMGDQIFVVVQGTNRVEVLDNYTDGAPQLRLLGAGLAPQGLALDREGGRLFVQGFISRTVEVYDLKGIAFAFSDVEAPDGSVASVARDSLPPQVLRGKRVFYNSDDPRMAKDRYMSCAACHLDGGSDQRVWDFSDRGEGLRRTVSLKGRGGMAHGPVHWSANFDEIQDFEHDIRGPFGGTGFMDDADFEAGTRNTPLGERKTGRSEDLDALAAYVASLNEIPRSPHRSSDGSMTVQALQGKALFHSPQVGCFQCHAGPAFTDSRLPSPGAPNVLPQGVPGAAESHLTKEGFLLHDVGTLTDSSGRRLNDSLMGLDTPTLLGIWENQVFLHDGSAGSVMEVLTTRNRGDHHGKTSHLSQTELGALEAYLLQLDGTDDKGGSAHAFGRKNRASGAGMRLSAAPLGSGGVRLTVRSPGAGPLSATVHDGSGRRLMHIGPSRFATLPDGSATLILGGRVSRRLPPGSYTMQVRDGSGNKSSLSVSVR